MHNKSVSFAFEFRIQICSDVVLCIVFAPVALIMPYDTIEEAIEIANDTRYALGASVFGPDKYECLEVASRLECGMVSINDFGVFYVSSIPVEFSKDLLTSHTAEVCQPSFNKCCAALLTFFLGSQDLPFGGTKSSGYGRFGQR